MAEMWDVLDEHGNKTGRLHERGKPMKAGDYHLVVSIWIVNSNGEFLISKRAPNADKWPNMWHITGGSAVTGDDSLSAALRETKEELDIDLDPENGQLFKQYREEDFTGKDGFFVDVWLFRQEADISYIVFQPGEISDAMWASKHQIIKMKDEGVFVSQFYPYIDELFRKI